MRGSSTRALQSSLFSLVNWTLSSSHLEDSTFQSPTQRSSRHGGRAVAQSIDDNRGIIIGSTLGGAALILVCLALVLYPIWQRRRTPPQRTPSRVSKTCPSPSPIMPRPSASEFDSHRVRSVPPSPRRLVAINTALPSSRPWDVEKATVHTPSGHPATIGWRSGGGGGNNSLGSNDGSPVVTSPAKNDDGEQQTRLPSEGGSISTIFAAEMSSILESISIKSSYSSLRSTGAAVLGVPTRLQTPLSVQKLRAQDSCATSLGGSAARGARSVSDGENVGPSSSSTRVPSKSSPPPPTQERGL